MNDLTPMKPLVEVDKGVWLRPEAVTAVIAQRHPQQYRVEEND